MLPGRAPRGGAAGSARPGAMSPTTTSSTNVRERLAARASMQGAAGSLPAAGARSGSISSASSDQVLLPKRGGVLLESTTPTSSSTSRSSIASGATRNSNINTTTTRQPARSSAFTAATTFGSSASSSSSITRSSRPAASNTPTATALSQRTMSQRLEAARKTGVLNLRQLGLTEVPRDALNVYQEDEDEPEVGRARKSDIKPTIPYGKSTSSSSGKGFEPVSFDRNGPSWWEAVDVKTVDISQNPQLTSISVDLSCFASSLTTLVLDDNALVSEGLPPDFFSPLAHLRHLSLQRNALRFLPDSVAALLSLVELHVTGNQLECLPFGVAQLPRLEVLEASNNAMKALLSQPPSSSSSTSSSSYASSLSLEQKQYYQYSQQQYDSASNQPPFAASRSLRQINLAGNQIRTHGLPRHFLEHCTRLRSLDLSRNALTSPSPSLASCVALTTVDLSYNQLEALPFMAGPTSTDPAGADDDVAGLGRRGGGIRLSEPVHYPGVQMLTCTHNRLTSIDTVVACKALSALNIGTNKLVTLPASLASLRQLKFIDASNNDLSDIPSELGLLPALSKLVLDGNPLRRVPVHKRSAGIEALKKYLASRIDDTAAAAAAAAAVTAAAITGASGADVDPYGGGVTNGVTDDYASSNPYFDPHNTRRNAANRGDRRHGGGGDDDVDYITPKIGALNIQSASTSSASTVSSGRHNPSSLSTSSTSSSSLSSLPSAPNRSMQGQTTSGSSSCGSSGSGFVGSRDGRITEAMRASAASKKCDLSGLSLTSLPAELVSHEYLGPIGLADSVALIDLSRNALGSLAAGAGAGAGVGGRGIGTGARGLSTMTSSSRGSAGSGSAGTVRVTVEDELHCLDPLQRVAYATTSLQTLILDNNGFTKVPLGLICLSSLRCLSIQKNKLTSAAFSDFLNMTGRSKGLLAALPRLEELDLRNNQLEAFDVQCLLFGAAGSPSSSSSSSYSSSSSSSYSSSSSSLYGYGGVNDDNGYVMHASLRILRLGYNNLSGLSDLFYLHFPSLSELDLSNNKLSAMVPLHFPHLRLQSVDYSNNNIATVPLEYGSTLMAPALATLQLVGNPQRLIRPAIVNAGPIAVLKYLRDRQPTTDAG